MFGFYDIFLGYCCKTRNKDSFLQYDAIVSKTNPEKVLSHEVEKVWTCTHDYSTIIAKASGYKCVQDYFDDCDIDKKFKYIKKPVFFLSAIDDPFFGSACLPIE